MELLAGWVPSTPEMEIKVLFGRHVWECAQHADALGKRAFELRSPLHYTREPLSGYRDFLLQFAGVTESAERLEGFYDIVIPGLCSKYRSFLSWTDPLMDEPSVRVMNTILDSVDRMQVECTELRAELPAMKRPEGSSGFTLQTDTFEEFVNPEKTETRAVPGSV
jgi:hypothetical protein